MSDLLKRLLPNAQVSKNAWVYGLGVYSSKLISLLVFPIVAVQLGMNATGQYDLTISTVGILAPIVSLQLGDAIYRWLKNADRKQKTIGVSGGLILLLLMLLLSGLVYVYLLLFHDIPYLTLGYLILIGQATLNVLMQLMRGNGQVNNYMHSMIIRSVVFAGGELFAVFFTSNKLENVLWAIVLANTVTVIWCAFKGLKKAQLSMAVINRRQLKKLLAYASPLVINALGWMLLMNANKYIIALKLGHEQNGVFAVTEKLASPIFFLGVFYLYSAQDYFLDQKQLQSIKAQFLEVIRKVFVITLLAGLILFVCSWVLLPLVFPDLKLGNQYLPWLIVANCVMVSAIYFSIPYLYKRNSFRMALTTMAGIFVSLVLCWFLVSPLGLLGPCLAILAGGLFTLVLRLAYSQNFFV